MSSRPIHFGYPVAGLSVTILLRRISDSQFWNGTGWQATEPSPALTMLYDTALGQYYSETTPSAACYWTAFEQPANLPIYYGDFGGNFPSVSSVPSSSTYTMAEVIDRIRTQVRDPGKTLWTDSQLLAILDKCNGWLMDQCFKKQATLELKKATYLGDGTSQWAIPNDLLGILYFNNPTLHGVMNYLEEVPIAAYDGTQLQRSTWGTRFYSRRGSYLYFVQDIGTDVPINLYYYPRVTKLAVSDTVPYDGIFLDLMVQWGETMAYAADEYSVEFEGQMLSLFMATAKQFLWRANVPSRVNTGHKGNYREKNVTGFRHGKRGRMW